ncbi:MAG: hypothetical protein RL632_82 [Bacteroidota bacterium]
MTLKLTLLFPICLVISSCFGPRNVDYKTVWNEQGKELKVLVKTIKTNGNVQRGNHDFPNNFDDPFNDGFHLSYGCDDTGKAIQLDDKNMTINFYTDRGLMEHFSAFIYTNDPKVIVHLDEETNRDKTDEDVKLEAHWYYIQN